MRLRCIFPPLALRNARRHGEVDARDMVVGIALLVLVPLVCRIGAGMMTGQYKRAARVQDKVDLDVPPGAEEIEARLKALAELGSVNAKSLLSKAEGIQDGILREHFRHWANRCLKDSGQKLTELESLIQGRPEFESYSPRVAALRRQISTDLDHAQKLDILGRDAEKPRAP